MEMLIYNTDHWFDRETKPRQNELNVDGKFDGRQKKGDVIEVREDGYWTGPQAKGYNKNVFAVITMVDEIIDRAYDEDNGKDKFKYNIDIDSITLDANNLAAIEKDTFESLLTIKV